MSTNCKMAGAIHVRVGIPVKSNTGEVKLVTWDLLFSFSRLPAGKQTKSWSDNIAAPDCSRNNGLAREAFGE